jgi:hypothetical protein
MAEAVADDLRVPLLASDVISDTIKEVLAATCTRLDPTRSSNDVQMHVRSFLVGNCPVVGETAQSRDA